MCKRSPNPMRIDAKSTGPSDWLALCGVSNFVEVVSDEPFVVQLQVCGNQYSGQWHDLWTHDRSAKVELRSDGQTYAVVPGGQAVRMVVIEGGQVSLMVQQVSYNAVIQVPETAEV